MGRRFVLLMSWVIGLTLFSTSIAQAKRSYTDWAFDVRRANEKQDLDGLSALASENNNFARVWFYGQVYDLVTDGLPNTVKEVLRPRLEKIAQALASATPADPLPSLFLDRIESGRLKKDAARARNLQLEWGRLVETNNFVSLRLVSIDEPELAHSVFYALIYRAELVRGRLGEASQQRAYLRIARLIAGRLTKRLRTGRKPHVLFCILAIT